MAEVINGLVFYVYASSRSFVSLATSHPVVCAWSLVSKPLQSFIFNGLTSPWDIVVVWRACVLWWTSCFKLIPGHRYFLCNFVIGTHATCQTLGCDLSFLCVDFHGWVMNRTDGCCLFSHLFYNLKVAPNLAETLYRYRTDLEIIFNIIDKDHSGKC